jgi:hypothetical protein
MIVKFETSGDTGVLTLAGDLTIGHAVELKSCPFDEYGAGKAGDGEDRSGGDHGFILFADFVLGPPKLLFKKQSAFSLRGWV